MNKTLTRQEALQLVRSDGNNLKSLSKEFKKDNEIVMSAVTQNGHSLKFADVKLRKDKKIAIKALQNQHREIIKYGVIRHVHKSLRKDKQVVLTELRRWGESLEYVDSFLRKDKEVVMVATRRSNLALYYADSSLKKNSKFILEIIMKHPRFKKWPEHNAGILHYVDKSLKSNKKFFLSLVKLHGSYLNYASPSVQKDKQIQKIAQKTYSKIK